MLAQPMQHKRKALSKSYKRMKNEEGVGVLFIAPPKVGSTMGNGWKGAEQQKGRAARKCCLSDIAWPLHS